MHTDEAIRELNIAISTLTDAKQMLNIFRDRIPALPPTVAQAIEAIKDPASDIGYAVDYEVDSRIKEGRE